MPFNIGICWGILQLSPAVAIQPKSDRVTSRLVYIIVFNIHTLQFRTGPMTDGIKAVACWCMHMQHDVAGVCDATNIDATVCFMHQASARCETALAPATMLVGLARNWTSDDRARSLP